jgi:hypothetical protein
MRVSLHPRCLRRRRRSGQTHALGSARATTLTENSERTAFRRAQTPFHVKADDRTGKKLARHGAQVTSPTFTPPF